MTEKQKPGRPITTNAKALRKTGEPRGPKPKPRPCIQCNSDEHIQIVHGSAWVIRCAKCMTSATERTQAITIRLWNDYNKRTAPARVLQKPREVTIRFRATADLADRLNAAAPPPCQGGISELIRRACELHLSNLHK